MKRFTELVAETAKRVREIFPWDLEEILKERDLLLLDVREPAEFEAMHIAGALNVPRGVLETACEYDYEETVPELVEARDREIVVICRSGNRSIFACDVMQQMGYTNVSSLKTGLRGWADYEQPLVNSRGEPVSEDEADEFFRPHLRPEQLSASHK
ncbi:MAG TPA: rhodanese-like domain-containing protein [Chromatiales bacterium]|nr:rhodanese-like domain-containing protein [Chromatiales bacterium]